PLRASGARCSVFGGGFPELESGVSIMLIYLWRPIQQSVPNNKNIVGLIIMNTENQAWQPPINPEHQCQTTDLKTLKADTSISSRNDATALLKTALA
ncbi:hypothetical protein, partial [Pseudomonas sp. P5_A2_2]